MDHKSSTVPLSQMSLKDQKQYLFFKQKETLDLFLEKGAISRKQYEKSLGDLQVKMGVKL